MSKFDDAVKQDTPRIVVDFKRGPKGEEVFSWGVVDGMPFLGMIGYITRVQAELFFRAPDECPEPGLVIAWCKESNCFGWFVHPDVPVDALVGLLETIKLQLIGAHIARQQAVAMRSNILGPDGQPMRG